jgi:prolyl oligopeptidase
MLHIMSAPPHTPVEAVTEVLHGVPVTDPYRWLEDQGSPRTREWIRAQTEFARTYLDSIPGRECIRARVRELLDVETYDSIQSVGERYFFRKRRERQEQPSIYMRDGADGEDELLVDPAERGTGKFTAVRPLLVSPDGRFLLYEVKEGGERTATFALLDIESRRTLPDSLPRGYLRGFTFAPDCRSFYYVHEAKDTERPNYRAAYQHIIGTRPTDDREIFFAGDDKRLRLGLTSDRRRLFFFVYRYLDKTFTDIYLKSFDSVQSPEPFVRGIDYLLCLLPTDDDIFAITDKGAPNRRIVKICSCENGNIEWNDVIAESDSRIETALIIGNRIVVFYAKAMIQQLIIFDLLGRRISEINAAGEQTLRMNGGSYESDEIFFETESFTEPTSVYRCSLQNNRRALWSKKRCSFDSTEYASSQIFYTSNDGMQIPMYLVGRRGVLNGAGNPTVMTSYGGYGVSMTPQFSILVAFMMERGCLFALPNIRGGSEFGDEWHNAAKRRNRQTAYDDFLCAAKWLIETGHTARGKLAIFGGSNSGLLVGAALTQRPDLFAAVVCMVPLLDMLRYHLFDNAHLWKEELGTAEDPDDFAALKQYSPYHRVRDGMAYPATMIISGDSDQNCNSLHARKMIARLQAADVSGRPIILDYSTFRGHSPVLPLSERIDALTDRLAFLCERLQLLA